MCEFYQRLATLRNEMLTTLYTPYYNLFLQLLILAFLNKEAPDSLPKTFILHDIPLLPTEIQNLLQKVGFDVEVKFVEEKHGSLFIITQKETQGETP